MVKLDLESKKIFYIEKEEFLRNLIELALKSKGAEVYTLENIEEHFYLIDDLQPDLILFDLDSSKKVIDRIVGYKNQVILVATGLDEHQCEILEKGIAFIKKPIEANNIAQQIATFLS